MASNRGPALASRRAAPSDRGSMIRGQILTIVITREEGPMVRYRLLLPAITVAAVLASILARVQWGP